MRRTDKYRLPILLIVLVLLHFTVRPRLGPEQVAPDFLLLALLLYTIKAEPGPSAFAGLLVGLARDALAPASFGAGALAHTLVGYLTAWGKSVFFADNIIVTASMFFVGTWVRNATVALASGALRGDVLWSTLFVWSPLQAVTTAIVGAVLVRLLHDWLTVRPRAA